MYDLFEYYDGELNEFIAKSLATKNGLLKRVIAPVSEKLIQDLKDKGIIIDDTWRHTLDNSAVRHTLKSHGSKKETLRGQIPVTEKDLMRIPEIVAAYDSLSIGKNNRSQDVVIYTKHLENNTTIVVEEVRIGRHELATCTIYKKKKEDAPTLID